MNQLLQPFNLPLQGLNKQRFALIVPLKSLDVLSRGGDCRGLGAILEGNFCTLNVNPISAFRHVPARDLGGEVVELRLEFVAVAALDEVVGGPVRMRDSSKRRDLAFVRCSAGCFQWRWTAER